jgi:hypothetical protein
MLLPTLKELVWLFVGLVMLLLISIEVVPTLLRRLRHTRYDPALTYTVTTHIPDPTVPTAQKPIPGSVVMQITITNSGHRPILPQDVGGGLCFHVEKTRKIYAASILPARAAQYHSLSVEPACLVLRLTSLAPQESITVQAVLDGRVLGLHVDTRVTPLNIYEPQPRTSETPVAAPNPQAGVGIGRRFQDISVT